MFKRLCAFTLLGGAGSTLLVGTAFAQVAESAPVSEPVQEVLVTGSRIIRSTFETPTPVTAISEVQLQAKAAGTVADLLRDVPALRPNRNNGSATDVGASTFNMRSLGPTRTLVLIDGQRVMNSSPTGSFDLNLLPAPLIKRMEIVTAGASSVYGSDAVTGVVNVFLLSDFTGLRADVQYNVSGEGDADNYSASLLYGTRFADDRAKLVVAASYYDRPDILYQGARDWGNTGITLIPNSAYTATNGQFRQLIVPDVRLSQMTMGGVITTAGALKNIQFGPGGAQSAFRQGTNVSTIWMQGGDGLMTQPDLGVLLSSGERTNVLSRLTYQITPNLEGQLDLLAARATQSQTNNYNYNNADITIRRDNAFLPTNIRNVMVANNLQTITLGRLNPELGINYNTSENTYLRGAAGLKGALPADWSWTAGLNYTYALYDNESRHNRINANWTQALDSVIGPAGTPICRSTLNAPSNGCIAANPFGLSSVSPEAVAYVTGTSWINAYSRSTDVNVGASGNLGSTWAGPIGLAFGGEYRDESVDFQSDPISQANGWRQASSASYRGAQNVKELYAESSLPLVKDARLAQSIALDLAGRYVSYSTSGSTNVWKVGLNWALNDQVRFRATYSKDFRSPTINELFAAPTVRGGTNVIDRSTNLPVVTNILQGGNKDLKPESAHTLTGGFVFRPAFLEGLQFSIDAFDIQLDDAISTIQAQEVVDRCAAGNAQFCAAIVRNSLGTITQISAFSFNAQSLETRGLDFELFYRMPLDIISSSWRGNLTLGTVGTYVDELVTVSNGVSVDTAGQLTGTNPTPKWRSAMTASYENGALLLRLLANYIGKGKYDNTYGPLDISKNEYGGVLYLDASAQYDFTDNLQVYAKIENLLDKDPPLLAEGTITRAGAANASSFYDPIGRSFGLGARFKW